MNFKSVLITLLISFGTVSVSCSKPSKACEKELEAIIYHPDNGALDYMARISNELILQMNLAANDFDSDSVVSVIKSFVNKYQLKVIIQPAIPTRNVVKAYDSDGVTLAPLIFGHILAPTYINKHGFDYEPATDNYRMATYANVGARSATIVITAPAKKLKLAFGGLRVRFNGRSSDGFASPAAEESPPPPEEPPFVPPPVSEPIPPPPVGPPADI